MKLYTSEVGEYCENKKAVSAAAYALLRLAVRESGFGDCGEIIRADGQKPRFASGFPHFSVSHSYSRVLVGVSEHEIGVDIELEREMSAGLYERLFSVEMRRDFTLFEGWTLRESVFKLTGLGNLRTMELRKHGDEIITPFDGIKCRLYTCVPGYTAACAAKKGLFPERITETPPAEFLRDGTFLQQGK